MTAAQGAGRLRLVTVTQDGVGWVVRLDGEALVRCISPGRAAAKAERIALALRARGEKVDVSTPPRPAPRPRTPTIRIVSL